MRQKLKDISNIDVEWSLELMESDFNQTVSISNDSIAIRNEWL